MSRKPPAAGTRRRPHILREARPERERTLPCERWRAEYDPPAQLIPRSPTGAGGGADEIVSTCTRSAPALSLRHLSRGCYYYGLCYRLTGHVLAPDPCVARDVHRCRPSPGNPGVPISSHARQLRKTAPSTCRIHRVIGIGRFAACACVSVKAPTGCGRPGRAGWSFGGLGSRPCRPRRGLEVTGLSPAAPRRRRRRAAGHTALPHRSLRNPRSARPARAPLSPAPARRDLRRTFLRETPRSPPRRARLPGAYVDRSILIRTSLRSSWQLAPPSTGSSAAAAAEPKATGNCPGRRPAVDAWLSGYRHGTHPGSSEHAERLAPASRNSTGPSERGRSDGKRTRESVHRPALTT